MSQRDKIVEIALSQKGYKEGANNDTKYGAWYGLNYNPWCAMFVSWCANQAGIPESIIPKFAGCTTGFRIMTDMGITTKEHIVPQKGDLIFFDWDRSGDYDHVGIVTDANSSSVYTVEGNHDDCVDTYVYPINASYIAGYARPHYDDTPTPTPVPPEPKQGAVAEIQQWLNDNYGVGLDVDNEFGSHTFHALVRAYQIELNRQFNRGIAVDGDYGKLTSAAYVTLREGARGNITRVCQALLICYGYDTNGFDGEFEHGTAQAVESYQRNNGLTPDKVVGRNTWDKLFRYK